MISDFDRDVYCLAGIPFDALDMNKALSLVRNAKFVHASCFMSTPNMNFITTAASDPAFLNSVIYSDIVVADGTPILWMAKLLDLPIKHRIAGSSLFEMLSHEKRRKMKVYFMGGLDGVAEEASNQINAHSTGLNCVGFLSPGFGTLDEMSTDDIINNINASDADFLVVALGAKKGQAWILKNLRRITIPLVSHLGAVINFEAKRFKRAPVLLQNTGFEWLWRIKEEPALWRRYYKDGLFFLKLLTTRVLPFTLWLKSNKNRLANHVEQNNVELIIQDNWIVLKVIGVVLDPVTPEIREIFKSASKQKKSVKLDLNQAEFVGSSFFGLVLMLKKNLDHQDLNVSIIKTNPIIDKIIEWNGVDYLKK